MSVLVFYDTLNSQLEAMKLRGLENNPNWVTMWDQLYQADKKKVSLLDMLRLIKAPNIERIHFLQIQ